MQLITDAIDFKPPRAGRWGLPLVLALVAHLLLMAALTWGIHWREDDTPVSFEAEIWSALPREAAPRAVQPPPPPPEPEPDPEPKPVPKPEPKPAPPPEPVAKQPDIATEKAKKKAEEDKRKLEEAKKEKAAKEKAEREKKEADEKKRKLAEQRKQEQQRKDAEKRQAQLADKLRKDQLARMMGQVGASGGPNAKGTALQSSGPSSGYAGRVRARVSPNIRYTEEFPSSLKTEIEVRSLPDGTITGRRVVRSSGNPAWDDAALKAIDRTGSLPRDVDGRVPTPIIIVVRPNE